MTRMGEAPRLVIDYPSVAAGASPTRSPTPGGCARPSAGSRPSCPAKVAGWHVTVLTRIGFELMHHSEIDSRHLRQGANADLRLSEFVYVFEKPT